MRCRVRSLAATYVFVLAGGAAACSSTQTSLNAPTADKCQVAVSSTPSAFTATTGAAHWETLLCARAIENLCYVVAPAQGGVHPNGRRTHGHTMIVGPWGDILAEHAEGEAVVIAEIDPTRINEVRASLPALDNRRIP